VIFYTKTVVILILQLLYDVHQMDVGLFDVEVKRIHFLEGVNSLEMQIVGLGDSKGVLGKVNVIDSSVGLKSGLIFADPKATLHLELVIGQEHPAEF